MKNRESLAEDAVEIRHAALNAYGDWLLFIESDAFKKQGAKYPYTFRRAFDGVYQSMEAHKDNPGRQAEEISSICGGIPERFNNKLGVFVLQMNP